MLGKFAFLLLAAGLLHGCKESSAQADTQNAPTPSVTETTTSSAAAPELYQLSNSPAGYYLAGRYAQHHQDWENASRFLANVIGHDPENPDLKKRAMVLAMGAGETAQAFGLAKAISETGEQNSLVQLFLALEAFGAEHYEEAVTHLDAMPEGGMADFINPLLKGWAYAARGELRIGDLPDNPVHAYHAVLISHYLGRHETIPGVLEQALSSSGINVHDLEKVGDIYVSIGKTDAARDVYTAILQQNPDNARISGKLAALNDGKREIAVDMEAIEALDIGNARDGVAKAFLDMSRILYGEYSDDSARVFARMALYLDPTMNEARILMAAISTRNERFDEAIKQYQAIGDDDVSFAEARKRTADLMARVGRTDEAVSLLEELVAAKADIDAQIQIGDLYRKEELFDKALGAYDTAFGMLENGVPEEFWHLHYARGMTLERLGRWEEAEADLQAALGFQPEHPYIMNYLGYGWAEQGIKLEPALELIRKAAAMQPTDGYIADSLGWVLYQMGNYAEAIPHLEKAVELMPYDPVINDHLGDAYWMTGRRLEAEFQWRRAKNFSEDETLTLELKEKLIGGLKPQHEIREAKQSIARSGDEANP
ncbi:MAG: tetratricopeptide repeat protein [Alphaproteobacteria bacterium]|nr:tetratricopeptide repeat protein [Alphaproteobacteria bacterium]